jgi:hypothetical protein
MHLAETRRAGTVLVLFLTSAGRCAGEHDSEHRNGNLDSLHESPSDVSRLKTLFRRADSHRLFAAPNRDDAGDLMFRSKAAAATVQGFLH